ncbi:MAG: phosphoribosylformylglycinamidine synthase subunit PurS [Gemmatimonadetes bacterium]|nr:phosphoribosylformylglycinamidine synthase subunit PurS [Gemmatimonadota bacterium]
MGAFRVEIRVMPRASLLDPQGQAVEHALHALGFAEAANVRVGKHLVLEVTAPTKEEAAVRARTMCDRLLANPVTEDFSVAVDTAGRPEGSPLG